MKYKVGDKVAVRRDEHYDDNVREFLEGVDYAQTIYAVDCDGYRVKDLPWQFIGWDDTDIEGIYVEPVPINDRFEILDL